MKEAANKVLLIWMVIAMATLSLANCAIWFLDALVSLSEERVCAAHNWLSRRINK